MSIIFSRCTGRNPDIYNRNIYDGYKWGCMDNRTAVRTFVRGRKVRERVAPPPSVGIVEVHLYIPISPANIASRLHDTHIGFLTACSRRYSCTDNACNSISGNPSLSTVNRSPQMIHRAMVVSMDIRVKYFHP